MIQRKQKKCNGTGKASGFDGCGEKLFLHKYGLCLKCYKEWCFETPEGGEWMKSVRISAHKKTEKEKNISLKKRKEAIEPKSYWEKKLQDEINKIVRLIDQDKGCVSCEHGWDSNFTRQAHAGHRYSVKAHPEIRYNLFNIFKQCFICNCKLSGNERDYDAGLITHYNNGNFRDLKNFINKDLKLTVHELKSALNTASKIRLELQKGAKYTREEVNTKLNIYVDGKKS